MTLAPERDLGTPAMVGEPTATVTIDGIPVRVAPGTSVLRAASLAGVEIPRLCATDRLEAFGSCRLCLVEVEGRKRSILVRFRNPVAPGQPDFTADVIVAIDKAGYTNPNNDAFREMFNTNAKDAAAIVEAAWAYKKKHTLAELNQIREEEAKVSGDAPPAGLKLVGTASAAKPGKGAGGSGGRKKAE